MSKVPIVDPNRININNLIKNAIPNYENMHIFVELTALNRQRTVLLTSGNGNYNISDSSSNEVRRINFLGSNQDVNNFTTNWYDGSTGEKTQYEGFGITKIDVKINSSFIPQVDIQFTDIRGQSFFNTENSPYRILFDFPPPIFELTIKGYFGGALTYQLHLAKYTTEFNAENGNFVIDGQFVAMTFAPLTDILFRYITNFPLMQTNFGKAISLSSNTLVPPTCTLDLIEKVRNLYSTKTETLIKNNVNTVALNQNTKELTDISNLYNMLLSFNSDESPLSVNGKPQLITIVNDSTNEMKILNSFREYDDVVLESLGPTYSLNSNNKSKKLYIGIPTNSNISNTQTIGGGIVNTNINALNSFRTNLISLSNIVEQGFVSNSEFPVAIEISGSSTQANNIAWNSNFVESYVALDITILYEKILKRNSQLTIKKETIETELTNFVNRVIYNVLGMNPTVYNIFKLILDDVDRYFDMMRWYSGEAEKHHNSSSNYYKIISTGFRDTINDNKIYSYPLIVSQRNIGNQLIENKIAPVELSEKLDKIFPELELVNSFIDSFKDINERIKDLNLKESVDGENTWIPYSPMDSSLVTGPSSPYSNKNTQYEVYSVLIDRFYTISQNAYKDRFYEDTNIVNTFAETEAINLSISLSTKNDLINLLKTDANNYYKNVEAFRIDVSNPKNGISEHWNISDVNVINGNYLNRKEPGYKGVVVDTSITEGLDLEGKGVIAEYFKESKQKNKGFWNMVSGWFKTSTDDFLITANNLLLIKDGETETTSRFLISNALKNSTSINFDSLDCLREGNIIFSGREKIGSANNDIIDVWADNLSRLNRNLLDDTIYTNEILETLYLSNFGYTASPFNIFPNQLNEDIFTRPSIVASPKFLSAYIGMLVEDDNILRYDENGVLTHYNSATRIGRIIDFYKGNNNSLMGRLIMADIHDINYYLSDKDKGEFKNKYTEFVTINSANKISLQIKNLIELSPNDTNKLTAYYKTGLKKNPVLPVISEHLLTEEYLYNFNNITFALTADNAKYEFSESWGTSTRAKTSDMFFSKFFEKLKGAIVGINDKEKEKLDAYRKSVADEDIVNETYYSFKNINDKWIAGMGTNVSGYVFNEKGKRLIDSFAFVDRAMNPIGDTILNPENLLQMFDDPNISVYTVLSSLLSQNGFEFFPLQNFMTCDSDNWMRSSFKINNDIITKQSPAFVCMYIGGSSSYPTGIGLYRNQFIDDGITTFDDKDGVNDFNSEKGNGITNIFDDNQVGGNTNFKNNWGQVRAFSVRFGEQNQTMFNGFKIDSKEYPETNESIQILARLAGDEGQQAPIPKGQNLYNLYENRSYKATITGMGNAMIQPTQYFQLENVPLYNGIYVILGVDHNIVPNKMTTSFYGTKVLKFPFPRVKNAAAIYGFNGSSTSSSVNGSSGNGRGSIVQADNLLAKPSTIPSISPIKFGDISRISSDFGPRASGDHDGTDIAVVNGTAVFATADGKVVRITIDEYEGGAGGGRYGNSITIEHGDGYSTKYAHLSAIDVAINQEIKTGQFIGSSGKSDDTPDGGTYHLHYEIRKNGIPVDPLTPVVLLPENVVSLIRKYKERNP